MGDRQEIQEVKMHIWLMEKLGLKLRETFRKNYMNPALELGIVQMTIPDKPNSRNQRYVRK
ncbi:MAG: Fic family protein [Roseburia faecis]